MEEDHYSYPIWQCWIYGPFYQAPSLMPVDASASTSISDHDIQDISSMLHGTEDNDILSCHPHTILQCTNHGYPGISHHKSYQYFHRWNYSLTVCHVIVHPNRVVHFEGPEIKFIQPIAYTTEQGMNHACSCHVHHCLDVLLSYIILMLRSNTQKNLRLTLQFTIFTKHICH